MTINDDVLTYEAFGTAGDGVTDDLPAICAAHEHANAQELSIKTKPDATYHLGSRALTAIIATDTDWNTSRFAINDAQIEDHKRPLSEVRSLLEPAEVQIDRLTRDQKRLAARPERDCQVLVENDAQRRWMQLESLGRLCPEGGVDDHPAGIQDHQ